jgi:hypothetical protein
MADPAGLCTSCVHAKVITSSKGSRFHLCQLSAVDPRFPKYPRLPVVICSGYQRAGSDAGERGDERRR